jgi:hypothetical protein
LQRHKRSHYRKMSKTMRTNLECLKYSITKEKEKQFPDELMLAVEQNLYDRTSELLDELFEDGWETFVGIDRREYSCNVCIIDYFYIRAISFIFDLA